jgi:NAD(P)-dependent dehydrogenase (short-subunit alcohol dehydrogenase family)
MIASIIEDKDAKAGLAAQHPWNALGRPEDVADAALFLSSDEA